jgi:hypothetical protein
MEILTDIAIELDAEAMAKTAHVDLHSDDGREFRALVAEAQRLVRPKAICRECYVDARGDDTVTIGGVVFASRTLRRNLHKVERVFAYVATCGQELDQVPIAEGDYLKQF